MKTSRLGLLALVVSVWLLWLAACGSGDAQVKAAGGQKSAGQAAGRQASGATGLGGLQFRTWVEPSERAMTVDVPVGWRTEGALQWRGDLDPRLQVVVTSPDGKVRVFFGDLEAMGRQVPSQWTFLQTGAREGQTFDVPATHSRVLVQHFMTGAEYARYHATERLCRTAKFIGATDDPAGSPP